MVDFLVKAAEIPCRSLLRDPEHYLQVEVVYSREKPIIIPNDLQLEILDVASPAAPEFRRQLYREVG